LNGNTASFTLKCCGIISVVKFKAFNVLPDITLPNDVLDEMREQVIAMAKKLGVIGLMNTQLAYQDDEIYILKCCGIISVVKFKAFNVLPDITRAAILANGTPIALETNGTVASRHPLRRLSLLITTLFFAERCTR
jgi:hypothetical protein